MPGSFSLDEAARSHLKLGGFCTFVLHSYINTLGPRSSSNIELIILLHWSFSFIQASHWLCYLFADGGGIWLFCVIWLWAEVPERFSLCRHGLIYFSKAALPCQCRISDFVVLTDLDCDVCCCKCATKNDTGVSLLSLLDMGMKGMNMIPL